MLELCRVYYNKYFEKDTRHTRLQYFSLRLSPHFADLFQIVLPRTSYAISFDKFFKRFVYLPSRQRNAKLMMNHSHSRISWETAADIMAYLTIAFYDLLYNPLSRKNGIFMLVLLEGFFSPLFSTVVCKSYDMMLFASWRSFVHRTIVRSRNNLIVTSLSLAHASFHLRKTGPLRIPRFIIFRS